MSSLDNRSPNNSTPAKNRFPSPAEPYATNGSSNSSPPAVVQSPPPDSSNKSFPNGSMVVVGVVVMLVAGLFLFLVFRYIWLRKRRSKGKYGFGGDSSLGKGSNYYSINAQHSHPNQQEGLDPHGMEDFIRGHHSPTGIGPPSGVWRVPHPLMNSGDMNSNNTDEIGPSFLPPPPPGLPRTLKADTFSFEELASATGGFSNDNVIGEGGFGHVYKGELPSGKEVAVKRLKEHSRQGEREFLAEIEIISRVHHRHLVSLIGYCISGVHRVLVYEFIPNGTLEHHLHGNGSIKMDWASRLKIALGCAKGIAYLHQDCNPRIIHRDIKASNVLINNSFEAKVSDFGLAKLATDSETHVSTRIMGTVGYLAPEYASTGKLTEKSDVFSFGVLLLELITGKQPLDSTNSSLVEWAKPLLKRGLKGDGNFGELVDSSLIGKYNSQEMSRMAICAASSVRRTATKRPCMIQIVRALDGDLSPDDLKDGMMKSWGNSYDIILQHNVDMMNFIEGMTSSEEFVDCNQISSKETAGPC